MKKSIECSIVRDLLPSFIDHVTSSESNKIIQAHLNECENCRAVYKTMTSDIEVEKETEFSEIKDALGKTKKMYMLKGIIIASAFLSILVSGIVNLAVSHYFSWFYIVVASVLYAFGITCIILFKDKNKIRDALINASVFILPLLGIIESVTNNFYLHKPIFGLSQLQYQ